MKQNKRVKNTFFCVYCEKEFKYISEKKRHESSHRTEFECKDCLKKFSFLSALRRHVKQHQRTGTVFCKECNGKFRDESLLKRHINYAHKGTFTCVKCLSTFNSTAALETHMKIHKSKEERKYKCNYEDCNKSFNFSHHLKHHVLTHTDSKQCFCNVCGKGFIQLHHLKRHLKAHEPESWLTCTVPGCTKKFASDYARKRHHATHKNVILDNPDLSGPSESKIYLKSIESPLVCTKCGELVTKQKLPTHAVKCLIKSDQIPPSESPVDLSKQTIHTKEELQDSNNNIVIRNIFDKSESTESLYNTDSNCKNAIGGCIVTDGTGDSEDCLCAQIPITQEAYESDLNLFISDEIKNESLNNVNSCKPCDSSEYEEKNNDIELMSLCRIEMPKIEYRHDGVIKITDTFDILHSTKNNHLDNSEKIRTSFVESMPLSCQAILGNCIVSGDGTIGDGCLCARMSRSSQQVIDQEIDEITICSRES